MPPTVKPARPKWGTLAHEDPNLVFTEMIINTDTTSNWTQPWREHLWETYLGHVAAPQEAVPQEAEAEAEAETETTENSTALFTTFSTGFSMSEYTEDIARLLNEYPEMRRIIERIGEYAWMRKGGWGLL
ncbi:hypothetical protein BC937DRAFT_91156 [Endogone sp. FLAS-F59071]|nr:hypothetical protein BC937DRAFT_91156 [Endogone sp. FLAS-F59071]|eukprot:RUS16484.1 hypothetical protein BC937DRAFT_91156 [Endogone sp. FLAS-F59071]